MTDWTNVYHRLPYLLKVAVASGRGYQLRRWRYGRDTERRVEEATDRETWSPTQWQDWQQERLGLILERAATRVPFYREQWARRRRRGSRCSWSELENWPVLTKETLRRELVAFVADDRDPARLFKVQTSGSTGTPLQSWQSRETMRAYYALFEARNRNWNGVTRNDRWANLGGQLVTPIDRDKPPFWTWNWGLRQLYLSTYHLRPQWARLYLEALSRSRVEYLLGYASAMHTLARAAFDLELSVPRIAVAISNAEPLYEHQRELIARVFGCPVRDSYGMAEVAAAASECRAGALHMWPEVGLVEVLHDDSDEPAEIGQTGRLVCTGLLNEDMPLIRYEVGDRGSVGAAAEPCACGRSLPVLERLEGRLYDLIITPDGRRAWVDPVPSGLLPVRLAQVVQEGRSSLRVLIVPAPGFSEKDEERIVRWLRRRVGAMEIAVNLVDSIPLSANGKFQTVVNRTLDRPAD